MNNTPNLIGFSAACIEKAAALKGVARLLDIASKNRFNRNITSKITDALEGTGPALSNKNRLRAVGTVRDYTTQATKPGWFLEDSWPELTRRIKINDPQASLYEGGRRLIQAYRSNLRNAPTTVRPDRYLP